MVEIGKFYRHYKGNLYKVIDIAQHTETGELLVIYTDNKYHWARPLEMFEDKVNVNGELVDRFKLEKNVWDN